MGECVVRMGMPKHNCEMAVEIKGVGDWCPIAARVCDYYSTKKMPDWCPIICSLPEGHGRLGDLDELWNLMCHYDDYYGAKEAHDVDLIHRDSICYAIEDAPTIVPAERREE